MATEEQTTSNDNRRLYTGTCKRVGQRLTISNRVVSKLSFKVSKGGSPTGNVTFAIRKVSDDSLITGKVWGNASALPSSAAWREATLDSPVLINEEVRIYVEYIGGNSSNYVRVEFQNTDVKGDEYYSEVQTISWEARNTQDCAYIYTYTIIVAPTVTTQAVSSIGTTTATGNGNITDTGGENCSKRGVCWNTTGNPTVADSKSEETDSFGTGAFTRSMTGLTPGQHYYVKAYAYNSEGYGYGSQVEFYAVNPKTSSDTGEGAGTLTAVGLFGSDVGYCGEVLEG